MNHTTGSHEQAYMDITTLSKSINALIESMQRLKHPIAESHEKVPRATTQLDKISQQTLAATNRMLDAVEAINQREETILAAITTLDAKLATHANPEVSDLIATIRTAAQANTDAGYALMDALQFQDITSQQVDYAASMLEEIETKLANILSSVGLDKSKIVQTSEQMPKKERAFDPHADLFEKKTQQVEIDSMFDAKE